MHTKSDYETLLTNLGKETGIESLVADESGLVSVRVQETYNLNLQFVEATGKILCFVEVVQLPPDAPKTVYRDLLVGGLFGKDTAGGHFTIEPETETVVYNFNFDLDRAARDVEEFIATLEKILQLCDIWAERIKANLTGGGNGEHVESANAFHENGHEMLRV